MANTNIDEIIMNSIVSYLATQLEACQLCYESVFLLPSSTNYSLLMILPPSPLTIAMVFHIHMHLICVCHIIIRNTLVE